MFKKKKMAAGVSGVDELLLEVLQEADLEHFADSLAEKLQVTKLEHFSHVKDADLSVSLIFNFNF